MFSRLLKSEAAASLGARILGAYLGFALRTTRWTLDGAEHFAPFAEGGAVVVAFWHQTLPMMPALWRRAQRANPLREACVLVSRHRDGRFIGRLMQGFGVGVVHGSTARPASRHPIAGTAVTGKAGGDKGGASSLRALLAVLARNAAVVITPDGPRGPSGVAAPGAVQLAALTGAPILPASAWTTNCMRLRSWDRMAIPLPFGRGALVCLPAIQVARDDTDAAIPIMQTALNQAATRARTLCGAS